jgi:hypothetical protein
VSCPGGGARGVGLSVDSTTFLLSVYNLQQKFEQNLHQQVNPKIYNLQFRQNALKYLKNQRNTFKHDSIEL